MSILVLGMSYRDAPPNPILDPVFRSKANRILMERKANCPYCRYNLSGVPGPRCPECGKNIEAYLKEADTDGWHLRRERQRIFLRWLLVRLALLVLTFWAVVLLILLRRGVI